MQMAMDSSRSGTCNVIVQGVVLLLIACVIEGRTILVGDSEGWRAGTNYTDWAIQNSPFHINDTLVFKYPPPSKWRAGQSVYLLENMWSYTTCEFRGAKLLGNVSEGAGEGFKVQLNHLRPYYFASAEGSAYDCIAGLSKFIALPSLPSYHSH